MPETPPKPSVLLVVESANTAKLVAKHLGDRVAIQLADDGEAAWDFFQRRKNFDVIVCDLALSMDSFGFLERLRDAADAKMAATPVLLLFGESDSEQDRDTAFGKGASDFINLPFSSSELIARICLHARIYARPGPRSADEIQPAGPAGALKQLSKRNFFDSRVEQEVSFSQRHRSNLTLARLSLDNMQAIIAGFDHATAKSIVEAVARIIEETLRREDSFCSFGEAGFCILYPATNGIGAVQGVNRIARNLDARKLRVAGKKIRITVSAAVYSWIAGEETNLEAIYRRLEQSLQQAAADGGNRVVDISTRQEKLTYSIDRALRLIENGKTSDLAAHAAPLLQSVIPLLEFVDAELDLSLNDLLEQLRKGA